MGLEVIQTNNRRLALDLQALEAGLDGLESLPGALQQNLELLLACCRYPDPVLRAFAEDLIAGVTSQAPPAQLADRFRRLQSRAIQIQVDGTHAGAPSAPPDSVAPTSHTPRAPERERPKKLWLQLITVFASSAGFWQVVQDFVRPRATTVSLESMSQPVLNDLVREATRGLWVRDPVSEQTIHAIELTFLIAATALLSSQYVVSREVPSSQPVSGGLMLFRKGMITLYAIWTSVYLVLAGDAWLIERGLISVAGERFVWALADLLHAASAGALLYCFCVLDNFAVSGSPERDAFGKGVRRWWLLATLVGVLSAAARLGVLGEPEPWIFANSLLGGLAIACLIGRFDSNWMHLPRLVVLPLYAFALLQILHGDLYGDANSALFRMPASLHAALFVVLLGFKLWLMLVVAHTSREGHLGQFMTRAFAWYRAQQEGFSCAGDKSHSLPQRSA